MAASYKPLCSLLNSLHQLIAGEKLLTQTGTALRGKSAWPQKEMGTSSGNMSCSNRHTLPVFQMLKVPAEDDARAAAGLLPGFYWDERPCWALPQAAWCDYTAALLRGAGGWTRELPRLLPICNVQWQDDASTAHFHSILVEAAYWKSEGILVKLY